MEKLKKCPFCGGDAEYVRSNRNSSYVQCLDCFIIGNNTALKADAIKAWNKRFDIKCAHPDCSCAVKCND